MSIYEPTTHETAEGINHAWNYDGHALCVCGCGKPMTPHAEGLSLECGRLMWMGKLADALEALDAERFVQVQGWWAEMESAA